MSLKALSAENRRIALMIVSQVQSDHRKSSIVERSGLDLDRLQVLMQEIHDMAARANLDIEIQATPRHPLPAFRSTTLRVKTENLCVHSRSLS